MKQLIDTLNLYLGQKAPQLPVAFKEFLVKISPYLVIIGMLSYVPLVFSLAGQGALLGRPSAAYPYAYGGAATIWGYYGIISGAGAAISLVLSFLALPGLFKPSPHGWNMVFYSFLVRVVVCCLLFAIPGVVGILIGAYILFQIRPYYFGEATFTVEPGSPQNPPAPPSQTPPAPPQA
jgi:hypothetical protein